MNDMLSFIYLASLFAVGGAAFSLMWKNISDIKNEQVRRYSARPHPEAPKDGEEILYMKPVEPSPDLYRSLRERMEEIDDDEDDDDGDIVVRR